MATDGWHDVRDLCVIPRTRDEFRGDGPGEETKASTHRSRPANAKPMAKAKKTMDSVTKTTDELSSFQSGNAEAFLKSGQVWVAGCQAITEAMSATAQAQLEYTLSTWKALSTVKSLQEAVEIQSSLARLAVQKTLEGTGKITEVSLKLAVEAIAPIAGRVTLAVEKLRYPTV